MGELRVTPAMRINANSDTARTVSQYAAAFDLDIDCVATYPHEVTANCRTFDHALRLARGFNLHRHDTRSHVHGGREYLHSRWSDPDSPLVVTNASLLEAVVHGFAS